jgi:hypothetical protein
MHIMLDLETLATSVDAAVIQIGACAFSLQSGQPIERRFMANVDMVDAVIGQGGAVDKETVTWWQGQPYKDHLTDPAPVPLKTALLNLCAFVYSTDGRLEGVWSHGASFDIPIVEHWMRRLEVEPLPWGYRAARDTRTLFALFDALGFKSSVVQEGTAHCAVDDAVYQALRVREAWLCIQGMPRAA